MINIVFKHNKRNGYFITHQNYTQIIILLLLPPSPLDES